MHDLLLLEGAQEHCLLYRVGRCTFVRSMCEFPCSHMSDRWQYCMKNAVEDEKVSKPLLCGLRIVAHLARKKFLDTCSDRDVM
jgi:hypothetical protein